MQTEFELGLETNREWPAVDANAMRVLSHLTRVDDRVSYDCIVKYMYLIYY